MPIYKNTAGQVLAITAIDTSDGSLKTGDAANITAQLSKDGAASAATDDTNPTELDSTNHPGVYLFDLTQAETNADQLVFTVESATADVSCGDPVTVLTADIEGSVDAALDAANTELASVPTTAGSVREFIQYLFSRARNKVTVTNTTETVYKEDGTTELGSASLSDDGTTFTKDETS